MNNSDATSLVKSIVEELLKEAQQPTYNFTEPLKRGPFYSLDPKWGVASTAKIKNELSRLVVRYRELERELPEKIAKAQEAAREGDPHWNRVGYTRNAIEQRAYEVELDILFVRIESMRKLLSTKKKERRVARSAPRNKSNRFVSWVKRLIKETSDPQAQYALGYRRGQSDYKMGNPKPDLSGYSESFINGYKAGVKDAKWGTFNDKVLKILTSLADVLGRGRYRP